VAGVLARRSLPDDPGTLALISNPVAASGVEPVALTESQLGRVERAFDAAELWIGPRAARKTLAERFETGARPCDVLAFVVHGGSAADAVRSEGLQLTPVEGDARGGLLLADEVEVLDLSGTGLVVLASCRAGGERNRVGDAGSASLGGAFLRAGAAATLDARGELPVTATVELLSAFFEGWREGTPADVALGLARQRIAADPATRDPFFHAQLRLVAAPAR
jgi:CHAT domain-containing protein